MERHTSLLVEASQTYQRCVELLEPLARQDLSTPRYLVKRVAIRLIEEIGLQGDLYLALVLVEKGGAKGAGHLLSTAIVTASLVSYVSLPKRQQFDAVMAALLHEWGQDTHGAFTHTPDAQAQRSLLNLLSTKEADLGHYRQILSSFQYRLGFDGTGTPKLRFPVKQHPISHFLAVAHDFVEILKDWKKETSWRELLLSMRQQAGMRYHPTLIKLLLRVYGPLPVGSLVDLSDERKVRVQRYQPTDSSWVCEGIEIGTREPLRFGSHDEVEVTKVITPPWSLQV